MESDTRKQLLQLFDSRVVDVALRQFQDRRGNVTTEEIAGWILDHGTAVELQIEHDAGAARQQGQQQKREQALGGLDRVFHREKKAVDELASLVEDGLHSVEALAVLAQEIESLTRNLVERKRLNGKTEDDIMDDMLHRSMMTSSSAGSTAGSTTPTGRAREIGRVLAPCARESYGVMSLSDAYRVYNRSRVGNLTEIATPDEFVGACRTFEAAGVPMRLERGAIFLSDGAAENFIKRVVDVVSAAPAGVSRVDVSTQMRMPVGIAALYLSAAEEQRLVVRDDTSRGIYYHINRFREFD